MRDDTPRSFAPVPPPDRPRRTYAAPPPASAMTVPALVAAVLAACLTLAITYAACAGTPL